MKRTVVFTGDVFRQQPRGGITRYFMEMIPRLPRSAELLAGLHISNEVEKLGPRLRWAFRIPRFRGAVRLAAPLNAAIDRARLRSRQGVIVHATYYRDPRSLPRGEPVVATVHDFTHERHATLFERAFWRARDAARHKAALVARSDRVVCYSEPTRRDLVERLGVDDARIRVIPLASRDWSAVSSEPIAGVPPPFFLWVGERRGYKNFERAVRAWSRSAAGDTRLLCIGGGSFTKEERDLLSVAGAGDRAVQSTCDDSGLRWAYENAVSLLYPSLWEGFGLPLVEAMALGCPVVASNRSSLPEVGGTAACYVDPESEAEIAAALAAVLARGRNPEDDARRRAQSARFSWDACAAAHERLYGELD